MPLPTAIARACAQHNDTIWLKVSLAAMRRDYPRWQAEAWHAYRPRNIAIVRAELLRRTGQRFRRGEG